MSSFGGVPRVSYRVPRSFPRGEFREAKVCLFLPELLWVAVRRRAAADGVSALHVVRVALDRLLPDWREASLVSSLVPSGRGVPPSPHVFLRPGTVDKRREVASEALWELPVDWESSEVAAGASWGVSAHARASRVAETRDIYRWMVGQLNLAMLQGQPALFKAHELIG